MIRASVFTEIFRSFMPVTSYRQTSKAEVTSRLLSACMVSLSLTHLDECGSAALAGTVAEGFAQAAQATEGVQVQLCAQLSQLHPHHALPPQHPLLALPGHTHTQRSDSGLIKPVLMTS